MITCNPIRKPVHSFTKLATVSTSYYLGAYQFAQKLSQQKSIPTDWLNPFNLPTNKNRVATVDYQNLIESAAALLDEPCFGLKYGQQPRANFG